MKNILIAVISFLIPILTNAQVTPVRFGEFTEIIDHTTLLENFDLLTNSSAKKVSIPNYQDSLLRVVIRKAKESVQPSTGDIVNQYKQFLNERDQYFEAIWFDSTMKYKRAIIATFDSASRARYKSRMRELDALEKNYWASSNTDRQYFYMFRYHYRSRKTFQLFPVMDRYACQAFFNNSLDSNRFLSNAGIISSNGWANKTFHSELYHDFIGAFRVGLSALVSDTKLTEDSLSQQESDSIREVNGALQRLISGGGNFMLTSRYPLLNCHSKSNHVNFKAFFTNCTSLDIQNATENNNIPASMMRNSLEFSFFYSGLEDKFVLFMNGHTGFIFGNNQFYSNIQTSNNKGFFLHQASIGIEVAQFARISYQVSGGSSAIRDQFKNGVSIQLIKNI